MTEQHFALAALFVAYLLMVLALTRCWRHRDRQRLERRLHELRQLD